MNACKRFISSVPVSGFTLMEIMVSLVIVSVVLVALFRMQAGLLDLAAGGRFKRTAVFLAAGKLGMIEQDPENQHQSSGEFENEFSRYEWTCHISLMPLSGDGLFPESPEGGLKKIDLEITGPGRTLVYHVVTYRYAEQ